jgi:hypothetical protein
MCRRGKTPVALDPVGFLFGVGRIPRIEIRSTSDKEAADDELAHEVEKAT